MQMSRFAPQTGTSEIERARYMLQVAARYIQDHWPDGEIFYDEAECDGHCVADDCLVAAACLPDAKS